MRIEGILATALLTLGVTGCFLYMAPPMYSHGSMAGFTTTATGQPDRFSHEPPFPTSPSAVTAGDEIFQKHCAECHGPEGNGDGVAREEFDGPQPPNLVRSAKTRTIGELYGLIAYGRPDMPEWRRVLEEKDLWNVVHYLRWRTEHQSR